MKSEDIQSKFCSGWWISAVQELGCDNFEKPHKVVYVRLLRAARERRQVWIVSKVKPASMLTWFPVYHL
jgi:hypothetical protein